MGHDFLESRAQVGIQGEAIRIEDEGFIFDVRQGQRRPRGQGMIRPENDVERFFMENEKFIRYFRRNRQGDETDLDEAVVDGGYNDYVS